MARRDPLQIGSDLLLLHEGTADLHILGSLLRHAEVELGFQPVEVGGQAKLRKLLKALVLTPHFKSPVPGYEHPVRGLAVVLDAETDAAATFRSIKGALTAAGLPAPDAAGTITPGPLKVGVFVVPDNRSPGKIETLCLDSVRDDPAWSCLEVFFTCVRENGGTIPENLDKARAQAFLATRANPALPVGLAAVEGYWRFESAAFQALLAFLRQVAET
jgi:hypothetical protein